MTPVKRKAPDGTGADAKATNQAPAEYPEERTLRQRLAEATREVACFPRLPDDDVRALGFEPTRWGWRPRTEDVAASIATADARRRYDGPESFRISGKAQCCVCGESAAPSTAGTPCCGDGMCLGVLMHQLLETSGDELLTRADGSGGSAPRRPAPPPKPRLRPVPAGRASLERARERVRSVRDVLERHGVQVRWGRTARCPLHDDEHPSMSLYERRGRSRAHCFPCDFDGDAIDLEAAINGDDVAVTIKRWGTS